MEELTQKEMDRQDIEDAREALAEGGENISLRDFMRELGDEFPPGDQPRGVGLGSRQYSSLF
jgi:hypothetical protein